ncbi:MAG: ATP-binding protein [Microlunatus sp.]
MAVPEVNGPEPAQLAGRIDAARDNAFVGRDQELKAVFDAVAGTTDVRVFFVHGPGGIGKTTLLDAMARRADRLGQPVCHLDARDVDCSPVAVQRVVRAADEQPNTLLLVDGYDLLKPLDRWLRTELLPNRPADAITVLAGREAPDPDWWLDPGWRPLLQAHSLDRLDDATSQQLLSCLGVTEQTARLTGLGRGYPLALAMLAEIDRSGRQPIELADAPDAVNRLCSLIIDDVPDDDHRTGLAVCAHATRTTVDLLAYAIPDRAEEVFGWLESRPYVRRGALGLYLHDVVRELFETQLEHRSPAEYARVHRLVRSFFLDRIHDPANAHPDRAAAEVLLLHRRTPLAADTSVLRDRGRLSVPRASATEREQILTLIETNEGSWSASLARRWLADQPRSTYHVQADDGPAAFSIQLYLPGPADLMADDPIAHAIWELVDELGPLRPGERVNVNRFGGASSAYQGDPLQLLVNGVSCLLEWCTVPAAWTFIVAPDSLYYDQYFQYLGLSRMLALELGGHQIVGYGWDRRRFPVSAFFEMMATRELTGEVGPPPANLLRPAPLTRPAFDAAVREALRRLTHSGGLAGSILLQTALVDRDSEDATKELATLLRRTITGLADERGGAEHRRVLERTYLSGAPSQEAAAEVLDLPFSTYRRHLGRATDRLVEVLWALELGGD